MNTSEIAVIVIWIILLNVFIMVPVLGGKHE